VVVEGEVEEGKRYTEDDFNRVIIIPEREAYRVKLFMESIDQNQKTLVFCATQAHAATVRDLINQSKVSTDPNYCVRVTANDGAEGERWLRVFQDNEKSIPTILTTSQKLSTGVDARNIRNIVLMRPVNSIIEFKQIIGRGTRLFDNKDYFTIYDFVKAYEHFSDPEWDGEPEEPEACLRCGNVPCTCAPGTAEPCAVCGQRPCVCERPPELCPDCGEDPCVCQRKKKVTIKLADGKERTFQSIVATTFWSPDGTPMSAAQFIERLYGDLPDLFKDEDELRALWSKPDTRKKLLEGLEEKDYGQEQLFEISRMIEAENSDLFDVLAYIAFASATISREERVDRHKGLIFDQYEDDKQQQFLSFVLDHYIAQGVGELDQEKLPDLLELKYQSVGDAQIELGSVTEIREMFVGFQEHLYSYE
jgi:type I restriction enzyme R subunit